MQAPSRERLVEKAKARLLRHGLPRLQMSILLALTGASGFLTSFLLLKSGVVSMALRYPVAVMVAYGVFLLLLRIWLAMQRDGWRDVVDLADADMVEMALDGVTSVGRGAGGGFSGGGGSFGGGGSSTSFQAPAPLSSSPPPAPMAVRSASAGGKSGGGGGKGFSFGFDLDDGGFLVLLAVLIVAVAVMGAAFYVLWTAPVLLAEVLVDGLIMTGLYRRLRKTEEPTHWLLGAVRRTWIPALAVAILFSFAGHLLQKAVPEARSIGPAVEAVMGGEEG